MVDEFSNWGLVGQIITMTADATFSRVEISVKCTGLADMDFFSKRDPMCVLYSKKQSSQVWVEEGRTEVIQDNLNPTVWLFLSTLSRTLIIRSISV